VVFVECRYVLACRDSIVVVVVDLILKRIWVRLVFFLCRRFSIDAQTCGEYYRPERLFLAPPSSSLPALYINLMTVTMFRRVVRGILSIIFWFLNRRYSGAGAQRERRIKIRFSEISPEPCSCYCRRRTFILLPTRCKMRHLLSRPHRLWTRAERHKQPYTDTSRVLYLRRW